jgi:hypothetical protein
MSHEVPGATFKHYSKLTQNDIRNVILQSRLEEKKVNQEDLACKH